MSLPSEMHSLNADDLAAGATSKRKSDSVMTRVHQHGCDWRYSFNASISAYGEMKKDRRIQADNSMFSLDVVGYVNVCITIILVLNHASKMIFTIETL